LGWVTMSERDVQRIGVLSEVIAERRTVASAAGILSLLQRFGRAEEASEHRGMDRSWRAVAEGRNLQP
jgi:hypothetical protein